MFPPIRLPKSVNLSPSIILNSLGLITEETPSRNLVIVEPDLPFVINGSETEPSYLISRKVAL